jgi:hypothetical protein
MGVILQHAARTPTLSMNGKQCMPTGGRRVSTPDMPDVIRHSLSDPDPAPRHSMSDPRYSAGSPAKNFGGAGPPSSTATLQLFLSMTAIHIILYYASNVQDSPARSRMPLCAQLSSTAWSHEEFLAVDGRSEGHADPWDRGGLHLSRALNADHDTHLTSVAVICRLFLAAASLIAHA